MVAYLMVKSQRRGKLADKIAAEINSAGIEDQVISIVISESGKFANGGLLESTHAYIYYKK